MFGIRKATRCFLDRKYSRNFFWENGIFATLSFLAGSMIVQAFMMILLKHVWNI